MEGPRRAPLGPPGPLWLHGGPYDRADDRFPARRGDGDECPTGAHAIFKQPLRPSATTRCRRTAGPSTAADRPPRTSRPRVARAGAAVGASAAASCAAALFERDLPPLSPCHGADAGAGGAPRRWGQLGVRAPGAAPEGFWCLSLSARDVCCAACRAETRELSLLCSLCAVCCARGRLRAPRLRGVSLRHTRGRSMFIC